MTISYVGSGADTTGFGRPITITKPAGVQVGDLLVAQVQIFSDSPGPTFVTVPSGWTQLADALADGEGPVGEKARAGLWCRFATSDDVAAASYTWESSVSRANSGIMVAFRGVSDVAAVGVSLDSLAAPSVTASAGDVLLCGFMWHDASPHELGAPSGMTTRVVNPSEEDDAAGLFASEARMVTGSTGTRTATIASGTYSGTEPVTAFAVHLASNLPPNAPIITSPADGQVINKDDPNVFQLQASDPDPGDSTSQSWWRYRVAGIAGAWTTVTRVSPITTYEFPAGTFAAEDYEVQAATRDAAGAPDNEADLVWSSSTFFTAAAAPPEPTIVAPVNGSTVSQAEAVEWSTPAQDAYQIRRVADNAGAPNTGVVYYDSGEVTSSDRSQTVEFPTNDRFEHVQVRIRRSGLWSSWVSVRVQVSWTPPTTPTVTYTLVPDEGAVDFTITNPAPGAGVPAVSYNDVFITDPGESEERRGTFVAANGTWRYWTPPDGFDPAIAVRVTAVADNGTTTSTTGATEA